MIGQSALRSGRVDLEYLICDGASTDDTLGVVGRLAGAHVQTTSQPDAGMYDALASGLRRATGDVVGYLNAGDILLPGALDVLFEVFEDRHIDWLTGINCTKSSSGGIVSAHLPFGYRPQLFRTATYGRFAGSFVQQESTFWRRSLHQHLDLERLATYRLAGDYFLWNSFARAGVQLWVVKALLGAFLVHDGQLSEDMAGYMREIETFRDPDTVSSLAWALFDDRVARRLPLSYRFRMSPGAVTYDRATKRWVKHGRLVSKSGHLQKP